MKVKYGILTDHNQIISHLILETLTPEAVATMPTDRNKDTEAELAVLFNGVPLEVEKFFEKVERQLDSMIEFAADKQARVLFDKYVASYNSKNSSNAKLSKIKDQIEKANQSLSMIHKSFESLKLESLEK